MDGYSLWGAEVSPTGYGLCGIFGAEGWEMQWGLQGGWHLTGPSWVCEGALPGSTSFLGGAPACDEAPGSFLEDVQVVWETNGFDGAAEPDRHAQLQQCHVIVQAVDIVKRVLVDTEYFLHFAIVAIQEGCS